MKMKKFAAAAMAFALVGASAPIAESIAPELALTVNAADAAETFYTSLPIVSHKNVGIYKDDKSATFKMSGRIYNNGIVFRDHTNTTSEITFDVSSAKSLSFTLGHIENANKYDSGIKVYVDDKLTDTIELKWTMNAYKYDMDVSKAKQVSFIMENGYAANYALGDITTDTDKPAIPSTRTIYKDMSSVIGGAYDGDKIKLYPGTDETKSFNMNGRTYHEGITFSHGYKGDVATIGFNVENCSKLNFTLGNIDGTVSADGVFNFYIDGKLVDTKKVSYGEPLKDCSIAIPKGSSYLRMEFAGEGNCAYGAGDIQLDDLAVSKKAAVPEFKDSKSLLESAYDLNKATIYYGDEKGKSFNVNGRSYYQGINFDTFSNDPTGAVSFNVENHDKISFSVGRQDSQNAEGGSLGVFIDNKEIEKIPLSPDMLTTNYEFDVKDAKNIRFVCSAYASNYAMMDVKVDDLSAGLDSTVAETKNTASLIKSAFNYEKGAFTIYSGESDKEAFNMNGRTYHDGFVVVGDYNPIVHNISFNVEDFEKITWDTGCLDSWENDHEGYVNVYLDNELKEKINLTLNIPITETSLDVSKGKVLRFEFHLDSAYLKYGIANIRADKLAPVNAPSIPEYKDENEFIKSGFKAVNVTKYTGGSDEANSFTVGGKKYYSGFVFPRTGSVAPCTVSFNTENVDGMKFSIGVANKVYDSDSVTLNIFKDNVLYKTFSIKGNSEPFPFGLDTKDCKVVRFSVNSSPAVNPAIYDMELGEFDPASLTTTTTAPVTTTAKPLTDLFGDINGDGIIDGRDASVLLTYYAKTSTGYKGSLMQYMEEENIVQTTTTGTGTETTTTTAELTTKAEDVTTKPETTTAKADSTTTKSAATTTTTKKPEEQTTTTAITDEPNDYGFYEVKNAPASGVSVKALSGTWENADKPNQYLYIKGDDIYSGTFRLGDTTTTESEGVIKLEYGITLSGTKEFWYNLYDKNGKFVMGFSVTGELPLTDLYAGQSGSPHFKITPIV